MKENVNIDYLNEKGYNLIDNIFIRGGYYEKGIIDNYESINGVFTMCLW